MGNVEITAKERKRSLMGNFTSIRAAFIGSIVVVSAVLLGCLTAANVWQLSSNMKADVARMLQGESNAIAQQFDKRLAEVGGKAEGLARAMSALPAYDMGYIEAVERDLVLSDAIVFGSGVWFTPGKYPGGQEWFGPYFSKNGGSVTMTMDYSNAAYDYTQFAWYKAAMKGENAVFWDEPAYDDVSKTAMMTSTFPFRRDGQVIGTVTVDIGMGELEDYIRNIKIGENGFAFLVTQSGYFCAYRDEAKNLKSKVQEESDAMMADAGKTILAANASTLFESTAFGEDSFVLVAPIGTSNLRLVLVAPKSDYMGPIHSAIATSIAFSLLVIVLLVAAVWLLFQRRIEAPIRSLMQSAEKVAAGKLSTTIEVQRDDEIGHLAESIRKMTDEIRKVIDEVNNMAQQVSAASEELFATADQSAQSMGEVAGSVSDVSDGAKSQERHIMETVTAIGNITGNIGDVNRYVQATSAVTEEGIAAMRENQASMQEAMQQMEAIRMSIGSAQDSITQLGKQSEEIGQIVETISEIAEQTNLLALNAAIEAARAGEAGRGFAVVADSVRKLAEQSQNAAQRVADLIQTTSEYTTTAVTQMGHSTASVAKGNEAFVKTNELFTQLVSRIRSMSQGMDEISRNVEKIAQETDGVRHSADELAQIGRHTTEETSHIAEAVHAQQTAQGDVTSASQSLANLAQDLQRIIGKFDI